MKKILVGRQVKRAIFQSRDNIVNKDQVANLLINFL
jgi:hypothetical protein